LFPKNKSTSNSGWWILRVSPWSPLHASCGFLPTATMNSALRFEMSQRNRL
jgi:hypothetical protein